VVSMTGNGSRLFIVYHFAPPVHGYQQFGFLLYDVNKKQVLKKKIVCLLQRALDWIGLAFLNQG